MMAGSKWWNSLSPKAQRAYIQEHPNSIYARGGSVKSSSRFKKLMGAGLAAAALHHGTRYLLNGQARADEAVKSLLDADNPTTWI